MLELTGKYNTAKVYTDNIDSETSSQVIQLLNMPYMKDRQVRIMPDCHAGKGCVVGTTIQLDDKVVPNLVGVDIGCGMLAVKLNRKADVSFYDWEWLKLDNTIKEKVPSGFSVHPHAVAKFDKLKELNYRADVDATNRAIGSLGGGNHFIEIDCDSKNNLWLVIHTGSRHLGVEVCDFYQCLGVAKLKKEHIDNKIKESIAKLKAEGKEKDIENTVKVLRMQKCPIPNELCYVEGEDFDNYIHDMEIVQEFAKLNRRTIANIILKEMGWEEVDSFDTIHNYINTKDMILRKGSISARWGERVIIPMNMRDGSLICIGKGNPDWNYSAPHGAGRILSRAQAKATLSFEEFKDSMNGVLSTSIVDSTIDEAPMVYKPMEEIIQNIGDTVDVLEVIKPIYNYKAH